MSWLKRMALSALRWKLRGISDYADSHKNDGWHGYASASAAAYARQLFFHMPVDEVKQCAVGLAGI
jgi:hypothetical protein